MGSREPKHLSCPTHGAVWGTIYADGAVDYDCGCHAPPTPPAPAVRHWQHDETGRVCDCVDCPGERYHEVNEAFAEAHEKAMREKRGTPTTADDATRRESASAEAMREACLLVLTQMGDDDMASDQEIYRMERAIEAVRALPLPAPRSDDAVEEAAKRVAADAVVRALDAVGVRPCNADDFDEIVASSVDAALRGTPPAGRGGV